MLVFGGSPFFEPGTPGPTTIQLLDLRTREVSVLPGSEGLWAPRWSKDGRHLIAHRFDFQNLMLFDFTTRKWEELDRGNLHFANWSRDGKYVLLRALGEERHVSRPHSRSVMARWSGSEA